MPSRRDRGEQGWSLSLAGAVGSWGAVSFCLRPQEGLALSAAVSSWPPGGSMQGQSVPQARAAAEGSAGPLVSFCPGWAYTWKPPPGGPPFVGTCTSPARVTHSTSAE